MWQNQKAEIEFLLQSVVESNSKRKKMFVPSQSKKFLL